MADYTYQRATAGSIRGGRSTLPAYLRGRAVLEWLAAPGTTLQGSPGQASSLPTAYGNPAGHINAENGSAVDRRTSRVWMAASGGHSDWAGNEANSVGLGADAPAWRLDRDHSAQADITDPVSFPTPNPASYADGRPAARHTYQGIHYIERDDKVIVVGGLGYPSITANLQEARTFDAATGDWDAAGTWPASYPAAVNSQNGVFAKHPVTEDLYFGEGTYYRFFKLNTSTKTWSIVKANIGAGRYFPGFECAAIDPLLSAMFVLSNRANTGLNQFAAELFDLTTGNITDVTFNASAGLTSFQKYDTNHAGLCYADDLDCFFYYFGGGPLIGGLAPGTPTYYIIAVDANTVRLATSAVNAGNGVAVAITGKGCGTQTLTAGATVKAFDADAAVAKGAPGQITVPAHGWSTGQAVTYSVNGQKGLGGRLWRIDKGVPNWNVTELAMTGATVPDGTGVANGNILSRFGYLPALKSVYALIDYAQPIYVARVA